MFRRARGDWQEAKTALFSIDAVSMPFLISAGRGNMRRFDSHFAELHK
jgi:hypothetical protein